MRSPKKSPRRRSPRRRSPRRRSPRRRSPRRRSPRRRSPRRNRRTASRAEGSRSRMRLKGAGCVQPAVDQQRTLAYRFRKNFSRWPTSWNPCTSCDCINMVPTAENRRKSGIKMAKGFKKDCLSCAEDYMNAYNFYKGTPGEAQARKRLERAVMMAEKASRIYNTQPRSAYTDLDPTDRLNGGGKQNTGRMKKKKQERKNKYRRVQKKKMAAERKRREKEMELVRTSHPDLYRCPYDQPCCQAITERGTKCTRQPVLGKQLYFKSQKCCMLCAQHWNVIARNLIFKGLMMKTKMEAYKDDPYLKGMSWDDYCEENPQYC